MSPKIIEIKGVRHRWERVDWYSLVKMDTDGNFKASLGFDNHTEFFADEMKSMRRWKYYAIDRYKKKYVGLVLAKYIIKMFLNLLMKDLIYNNDRYYFPDGNSIHLKVGVLDNKQDSDYVYNPATFGDDYGFVIVHNKAALKRMNNNPIKVKGTQRWRYKIYEHSKKFTYN